MMNTSDEWKSLFPIASVHSPPLFLSPTTTNNLGPLIFNPSSQPQSHRHLFTSHSTFQIPSLPELSHSRLAKKSLSSSSLPPPPPSSSSSLADVPYTTASISPKITSFLSNPEKLLAHNSLQLLRCPGTDSTLAFFPTGSNSDQVGFVILSVVNSQLKVTGEYDEIEVYSSENESTNRIIKISVTPLADCEYTSGDYSDSVIGYLMVSTVSSVNYYLIKIRTEHSGRITPGLELIDSALFEDTIIICACWNPHIPEESLVLLENGDLFLFDLESFLGPLTPSQSLTKTKVNVLWEKYVDLAKGNWVSCDFSWHPRILIVVHSSTVFLVDSRSENSVITPLLKSGIAPIGPPKNEKFLAFSVSGHDRFHFTLASNYMVYLCDIRKLTVPVLCWAHNLADPSYITVTSLSNLRSLSEDVTYNRASETGYGILLGSFWNCEFSLFCYGPGPVSSSFYAWGLPSDITFDSRECHCGSCLVKEDFYKDQLPVWINWQQKKDFVMGFGILDKEIASRLFKPDGFGGFTVITLTSLGNLELHRYYASWDKSQISENSHFEEAFDFEDSFFNGTGENSYNFKQRFPYMKFDFLGGYLKSDLERVLSIQLCENGDDEFSKKTSFGLDFHECICQNLKYSSNGPDGSIDIHIDDVFQDINLPASIHEVALRSMWSKVPKNILKHAFVAYSDVPIDTTQFNYVPVEFLEVPCQQPQLLPFFFREPSTRGAKWSKLHKPSTNLIGPVVPLPFLMAYNKSIMLKGDNRSVNSEIDLECDKVMKVANEVVGSGSENRDHTVSLADDNEDVLYGSQNLQKFSSYKSRAMIGDCVNEDEKHVNMIFRVGDKGAKEVFDSNCLVKFKFNEQNLSFGVKEMELYRLFKRQYSNFKQGFQSYNDFVRKSNINE